MKTVPGVIDHHHPEAEVECTASLIAKHPNLVLHHIREDIAGKKEEPIKLRIVTHRLPDFDSISSIFLALKLIEIGKIDPSMEKIAHYARMVDCSALPKDIDLTSTPYSILRSLFSEIKRGEEESNLERVREGLKFMNFLYSKSEEGYEILDNKALFSGIDRYGWAMRKAEDDYFSYLSDINRARKIILHLPLTKGSGKKKVDGLVIKNPQSFLLKEWARRDRENSSLREGFGFLATNFWNKRYILGVDPEKEVNLRGLGDLLNEKEVEKRTKTGKPFTFRWYDGNCPFFNFRIIDSPQDGTSLSQEEVVNILLFFGQNTEAKAP
ncbi:MAG: hypothetical protein GTN73_00780 [Candidatus Aminicenantes bacterium]|nr:hypothetical protein [Candidatus Aminicenantes bacterium]